MAGLPRASSGTHISIHQLESEEGDGGAEVKGLVGQCGERLGTAAFGMAPYSHRLKTFTGFRVDLAAEVAQLCGLRCDGRTRHNAHLGMRKQW